MQKPFITCKLDLAHQLWFATPECLVMIQVREHDQVLGQGVGRGDRGKGSMPEALWNEDTD